VPIPGQGPSGLAPWEYTIAELLSDAGYATSLWGRWHLGDVEGRLPNDQGFDEWWGFKNSADECGYTSYATYRAVAKARSAVPAREVGVRSTGCTRQVSQRSAEDGRSAPRRAEERVHPWPAAAWCRSVAVHRLEAMPGYQERDRDRVGAGNPAIRA